MSVTVPLVTIEPPSESNTMADKTVPDSNHQLNVNFTQVHECVVVLGKLRNNFCKQRVGRWMHRLRRTRQMMTDVHPGPDDAGFIERFASAHDESRSDIGRKAFLCRQHCHGSLVVDTTQKGHYRVGYFFLMKNMKES